MPSNNSPNYRYWKVTLFAHSVLHVNLSVFSWVIRNEYFFLSDLSAVRHFIATDRKGTLNSIRKTSAPAELSILDREDYSKSSVSSSSITRTSCPQVTSVFPHPDLCPRYEDNLIILMKIVHFFSDNSCIRYKNHIVWKFSYFYQLPDAVWQRTKKEAGGYMWARKVLFLHVQKWSLSTLFFRKRYLWLIENLTWIN